MGSDIILGIAVLVFIEMLITGMFSHSIAIRKGYTGTRYFYFGFFLNILGLLYAVGLPVIYNEQLGILNQRVKSMEEKMQQLLDKHDS